MGRTMFSHGGRQNNKTKQAGAELGQAQLKLGLDFNSINLYQLVLLYFLSRPTFPFTPIKSNLK